MEKKSYMSFVHEAHGGRGKSETRGLSLLGYL